MGPLTDAIKIDIEEALTHVDDPKGIDEIQQRRATNPQPPSTTLNHTQTLNLALKTARFTDRIESIDAILQS